MTDVGVPSDSASKNRAEHCAAGAGDSNTLAGANLRLRLEPVLNVHEDVKVKMQVDVLDNIVLGSTPDSIPQNTSSPLVAFSQTQVPPSDGTNALSDSIRVKRVWAEIMTPLGELRVGRMPSQFGFGVLANEDKGLDSNYGDTNDRILFATKIGDYYIVPAFDWAATGPTSASRYEPYGQPFDRDQRDDVDQYILAVVKRDKDEDIAQKLDNDQLVFDYGTYQVLRHQALDAAGFHGTDHNPETGWEDQDLVERRASFWAGSFWLRLLWRKLSIEAEYAAIVGRVENSVIDAANGYASKAKGIDVNQHGFAANAEYKLLRDALTLRLLVVGASGDSAPGWGVTPLANASGTSGTWDGTQAPSMTTDHELRSIRTSSST